MACLRELKVVGLRVRGVQGWHRGAMARQAHGADRHRQIACLVAAPLHTSDLINRSMPYQLLLQSTVKATAVPWVTRLRLRRSWAINHTAALGRAHTRSECVTHTQS